MTSTQQPATSNRQRIAVVGGGINGAGASWELARRDYDVTLFDKGVCGAQTSSATTKMIHGGLRYLERMHFGLVRESLRERAWLLEHAPTLVHPLEILLPIYDDSPRSRAIIKAGLILYDRLARDGHVPPHQSHSVAELLTRAPLTERGLRGGFSYSDAQVDDFALVRSVVASALRDGASVREQTKIERIRPEGKGWLLRTARGDEERFDAVVNAAGPWMNELLRANGIAAPYVLSLVRGSHLVLKHRVSESGLLLQSSSDRRVFFVLPWKGTTLVGTTEVVQKESPDHVQATGEEVDYLIQRFNRYLRTPISRDDVQSSFAGVRPLVGRSTNPSAIGRDFRVVRRGSLINVFGGKMTTFMALARKVALRVDNYFGDTRVARPAVFAPPISPGWDSPPAARNR
ncbi:MAG: glycerol-3-phosphate dehydrogenase/oxidase [Acidobacteriota bacterium]